jgi:hypothetical protein
MFIFNPQNYRKKRKAYSCGSIKFFLSEHYEYEKALP